MNISSKFSDIFAKVFALFGVFFEKKIWNLKGDRPAWEHFDGSSGKKSEKSEKIIFQMPAPSFEWRQKFLFCLPLDLQSVKPLTESDLP